MKIIKIILGISLVLTLNSCMIKNKPIDNTNFANVKEIKELEGCYYNTSDDNNEHNTLLSQVLWKEKGIIHQNIKIICVKALNTYDLEVVAKNNKRILYKKIFTKDRDFALEFGHITLLNKLSSINENFAGVAHESTVIGIDTEGNGKLTKRGSFIGIAIFIPFAGNISESYRFKKIQ